MERKVIKVKEWVYDRECRNAKAYNIFPDVVDENRNEIGAITADENGYIGCIAEILCETEKAVYVILESGSVVGNSCGWKCWIPKSQIA